MTAMQKLSDKKKKRKAWTWLYESIHGSGISKSMVLIKVHPIFDENKIITVVFSQHSKALGRENSSFK